MALATVDDVKRILRLTDEDTDRDAQLQAGLDAIESVVDRKMRHIGKEGNWVEVYFDVYEDATLRLPADDVTVTVVKVFEYPSSAGVPLSPVSLGLGHGYDQDDEGNLMLRPTLTVSPFEGAVAVRRLRQYSRVEVHYIGSGVIPRAVVEGVAWLAAGYYQDGPRMLAGLKSERIGDYSYTRADGSEPEWVCMANFFLGPYQRKARVSVT